QSRRQGRHLLRPPVGPDLRRQHGAGRRRHLQDHGRDLSRRRNHRGEGAGQPVRHRALREGAAVAMSAATTAAAPVRRPPVPVFAQRLALAALLLALWWLLSLTAPPYVLPRPERVFTRIVQLTQSGDLPVNLLTTLGRVLAGFAIAVVI